MAPAGRTAPPGYPRTARYSGPRSRTVPRSPVRCGTCRRSTERPAARSSRGRPFELTEEPDNEVGMVGPDELLPRMRRLPPADRPHLRFPAEIEGCPEVGIIVEGGAQLAHHRAERIFRTVHCPRTAGAAILDRVVIAA